VEAVLSSLGLAEEDSPPRIEVWNKLDLLPPADKQELIGEAERRSDVVAVSALTGEGVDGLRETISHLLHSGSQTHQVRLNAGDGERIAWLHARGEVLEQQHDGDQLQLSVKLSPENWARFERL
jgi:GTP-binding protein HflX